jgi:predicted RNA-binding Zn-ribbon protein involved in translation (DUF1610 family)
MGRHDPKSETTKQKMSLAKRGLHYALKSKLKCRRCGWVWMRTIDRISQPCPKCGGIVEARQCRRAKNIVALKKFLQAHPRDHRAVYAMERKSILSLVGKGIIKCANCSCDRPELLEVNHINGGGGKEHRLNKAYLRDVLMLRRKTDDLELRCRVCNALHALELRFGKLPFRIEYIK